MEGRNCPYCGKPMEKGYIDQARGLSAWVPEGTEKPLLFPFRTGNCVALGDTVDAPLLGSRITADLCRDCGKIIIDVSG